VRVPAPSPVPGPALRYARAGVVAAVAWGTAGAGHVLAGGQVPSPALVLVLAGVSAGPLSVGLRQKASRGRMIALLAGAQAGMHTGLVVAAWNSTATVPHPAVTDMSSMPGMAPMHGVDPMAARPFAGAESMGAGHAMGMLPGPVMLGAHLASAIVLGLFLAHGERVLFSLLGLLALAGRPVRRLHQQVSAILTVLTAGLPPRSRPAGACPHADTPGRPVRRRFVVTDTGRRGPPMFAALAA
jgi:hypothetical protein